MIPDKQAVTLMKLLANPSRLKIVRIIYTTKHDLCVNEISQRAKISQSLTSHHLAFLAAAGVVEGHRMGQTTCYVPAKNTLSNALSKVLQLFKGV